MASTSDNPKSHAAHPVHDLYWVNPDLSWSCNVCKCSITADVNGILCYNCEKCNFHLCEKCYADIKTPLHIHTLYRTDVRRIPDYNDTDGNWACDVCEKNNEPGNYFPAHCPECLYDLCDDCINNTGGDKNSGNQARAGLNITVKGDPVTNENAPPFGIPGSVGGTIPECVICRERPKDATIVHGGSGHKCCCMSCAQKLHQKGARCPICLAPIENVIRAFDS